jgi:hypothetical protein
MKKEEKGIIFKQTKIIENHNRDYNSVSIFLEWLSITENLDCLNKYS